MRGPEVVASRNCQPSSFFHVSLSHCHSADGFEVDTTRVSKCTLAESGFPVWQVADLLEILRNIDDDTERAEFLAQVLFEGPWRDAERPAQGSTSTEGLDVQIGSLRAHISTPTTPHVYRGDERGATLPMAWHAQTLSRVPQDGGRACNSHNAK